MKLERCPFCGGTPQIKHKDTRQIQPGRMAYVECDGCGARGGWIWKADVEGSPQSSGESAARRWNRRNGQSTPDPRAGLRRCAFQARQCTGNDVEYTGYFHKFYADADNEPGAIVETDDGTVLCVYAWTVRFTDIPEVGNE